ncbi:MAG TPA: hypothetical protein VFN86_01905, partial [Casimicrobiaceae bacterium]|nr:hypothetical protein [Casimicrobiaceae bacterium]
MAALDVREREMEHRVLRVGRHSSSIGSQIDLLENQIVTRDRAPIVAQNHGALEHVAQLAKVARPAVFLERGERVLLQSDGNATDIG